MGRRGRRSPRPSLHDLRATKRRERTLRDLAVLLDTKTGTVATILERLAAAGAAPVAGCFFPRLDGRVAHVTFEEGDVESAREVLIESGFTLLDEREVLVVPVGDDGLAGIARRLADAGAGTYIAYLSPDGRVVIGTQDLAVAKTVLGL